jgi:CheY-like chemotaxis protein
MRCGDKPFSAATALVVDDDSDMCRILELALASAGCTATTVGSAQGAIALFADHPFPVVFVDARLPDMDGWRLIEELRGLRPEIGIIMISGYYFEDDVRVAKALQASEIDGFLAKPFRVEAVVAMVAEPGADGHRHPIRSGDDAHIAPKQLRRLSPRRFLNP